jgi:hypothetical protein
MKNWWQRLSVDWPCALGDWLWAVLVVAPPRYFGTLTRRKLLHLFGILLLLFFFQYVAMLDLTFLFAMDLGLLMEVSAMVFVLTLRDGVQATFAKVKQGIAPARLRMMRVVRRAGRAARHAAKALKPPAEDDERGAFALRLAA